MKPISILIIDDETKLTNSLALTLRHAGMRCFEAHNGFSGMEVARKENPDIVLLDVRMPGASGLEVLSWLNQECPDTAVIVMSAFDDTQDAVTAMKSGAVDYLAKPFDIGELVDLLKEVHNRKRFDAPVHDFGRASDFHTSFLGKSFAFQELKRQISCIRNSNLRNVLILGETGTGKAVVARQLHFGDGDDTRPFVEVNCATLTENEMDVELYGAEKETAPGFSAKRKGLIEIANGGTLLLDEIGELSLSMQAKLLNFIETRYFRPIGSMREHFADVMIIATSNQSLESAVRANTFRQDLFFRLNVMPIRVPPLRERSEDALLLATHFAHEVSLDLGMKPIGFSKEVKSFLSSYAWPGNVRELKNLIEQMTVLHSGQQILMSNLPPEFQSVETNFSMTIEESLENVERSLIVEALQKCRGRKGLAADRLGISRHALKRKMQRLNIQ